MGGGIFPGSVTYPSGEKKVESAPQNTPRKIDWNEAIRFVAFTVLSLGTYPLYWLAKQAPRYNREALLCRAARINDPVTNPTSWAWIRSAWKAWAATFLFLEGVAFMAGGLLAAITSGSIANEFRMTGHIPGPARFGIYLSMVLMLIPQGYVMVEFCILAGHTVYPERAVAYIKRRYAESLDRTRLKFERRFAAKSRAAKEQK
jgi:hypothetical protein